MKILSLQALNFYKRFKKEISIDQSHNSPKKEKPKRNINSVNSIRDRNLSQNSLKRNSNIANLEKNKKKPKIIFENRNIVINDITKKYSKNKNTIFTDIKKIGVIHKLKTDNSTLNSSSKYKNEKLDSESNKTKDNSAIKGTSSIRKSENRTDFKNRSKNIKGIKHTVSKNLMKTSYNEKKQTSDNNNNNNKSKNNKNNIQNKIKKNEQGGDSYEFNFTFNNYNSNFTYNNLNGNIIKEDNKKSDKILFQGLSHENIINKFNSINSTSVRNNILGGIKNILNKNKKDDQKETSSKDIKKIIIKKKKRKNDRNYCATKIQKVFRGYYYRKYKKINKENNNNENDNNNKNNIRTVYIKKKIVNNRSSLNYNANNTDKNLIGKSLKERNLLNLKNNSKTIENDNENKIQEIIIDKRKIFNALNPAPKGNNIREIKIKNNFSFKTRNCIGVKFRLSKCFNYWQDRVRKKIIIQKLIQYKKCLILPRNQNILKYNIRYQIKNGNPSYRIGRFNNNNN